MTTLGTYSFTDGNGSKVDVRVDLDEARLPEFARDTANKMRGTRRMATRSIGVLRVVITDDSAHRKEGR